MGNKKKNEKRNEKTDSPPTFSQINVRSYQQMAAAIKRVRRLQGLTQIELAKKSGLTQATISRVESGSAKVEMGTLFILLAELNLEVTVKPRPKPNAEPNLKGLY